MKSMTAYQLRKIYREEGISYKKIMVIKKLAPPQKNKQRKQIRESIKNLEKARDEQYQVCFVDEIMFTYAT